LIPKIKVNIKQKLTKEKTSNLMPKIIFLSFKNILFSQLWIIKGAINDFQFQVTLT